MIRTPDKMRTLNRSIRHEWDIGPSANGKDTDWARLTIDHDTDRKRYDADLTVYQKDTRGGESYLLSGGIVIRLPSLPAPRYNAKTLGQFAIATLSNLETLCRDLPVDNERRIQVWNQARELLEKLQQQLVEA